jgi:hypothetical protein
LFHDSIWIFGPQASRYYCPGIRNPASLEPLITKREVLYPQLQLHLHPSIASYVVVVDGGGVSVSGSWWWKAIPQTSARNGHDTIPRNTATVGKVVLLAGCCGASYLHLRLPASASATPAPSFRSVSPFLRRHKQPLPLSLLLCSPVLSYPLPSFALPCQVARESSPSKISNRARSADTDQHH